MKTRSFPTARIILVMALWAGCFPLITAGLDLAPHLTFAAMRAGIAGAALVVAGMIGGRPWPSGLTTWLLVGTAGLGATSLGFLGMFHAAEYVTPGLATVIANTQPLLAAALGFVVLGERVSPRGALGLAMGFAGILVIAAGQLAGPRTGDDFVLGIVYIVLAAAGVTVGNVVFRRLAGTVDPVTCMGSQLLLGAIPLAVAAAVTESGQGITLVDHLRAQPGGARPARYRGGLLALTHGVGDRRVAPCQRVQLPHPGPRTCPRHGLLRRSADRDAARRSSGHRCRHLLGQPPPTSRQRPLRQTPRSGAVRLPETQLTNLSGASWNFVWQAAEQK